MLRRGSRKTGRRSISPRRVLAEWAFGICGTRPEPSLGMNSQIAAWSIFLMRLRAAVAVYVVVVVIVIVVMMPVD